MMIWIWLGCIVGFGILEALTAGLISIWFVAGGIASLLCAILGASTLFQVVVFIAVSAAALVVTRPLVKRYTQGRSVPTNADRVLGQTAKVTEAINNENSTGAVYVDGKTWTARTADGQVIPEGALVQVERMEGVKLFVTQKMEVRV
ncbi:MAG: NfeD family protein [Oscillibacter sp.]|nr:NfeD family protein [Oscillibacter sp.]